MIITNEDNVIENLIAADPMGKSDHVVMQHEYLYSVDVSESRNSRYLYESGDYLNFSKELLAGIVCLQVCQMKIRGLSFMHDILCY